MANGNQNTQNGAAITDLHPTCLESVNRFSKLPVVDSTIKTAMHFYENVKEYNGLTHWTLSTAENTVNKAVEVGMPIATPVIKNFEGPIKRVDNALCTGLSYVEDKVPAVKLPAGEIYHTGKDYVSNTVSPAVETARAYAEPAVKTAKDILEPCLERAKSAVEPALEKARNIVEPLVQPAVEKANAFKDNVMQKVDEYLHLHSGHAQGGDIRECAECQEIRRKTEERRQQQQQEQQQEQNQQQHQ